MLALALLLAAAPTATPAPSPAPTATARPAPLLGRAGGMARPKSLSEHAAEMKAKGTPAARVSFDDVATAEDAGEDPIAPAGGPGKAGGAAVEQGGGKGASADAAAAQRRMDRAVERGLAVPERTSTSRRDRARREWDEAAEACRRTPGCVPHWRDDARYGEDKPLKTDQELIEEVRKRGFSEPHPTPR